MNDKRHLQLVHCVILHLEFYEIRFVIHSFSCNWLTVHILSQYNIIELGKKKWYSLKLKCVWVQVKSGPVTEIQTETRSGKSLQKVSQAWNDDRDCTPYLFLTCKETYLALKLSIMALLAWSISFWASPRRLWERLTACMNTHECIYLQDERQREHKWGERTANVFWLKTLPVM